MSLDQGDLMAKLDQIDKRLKHSEEDRDVIKKELRYNKHEYLDSYFNLAKATDTKDRIFCLSRSLVSDKASADVGQGRYH